MIPQTIRITCKQCKRSGTLGEFQESCDNEGCQINMARRRGRANKNPKPPALLAPVAHHPRCACARCLDADADNLEKKLEDAWIKHNQEAGVELPRIKLSMRESAVQGPYDGLDFSAARYVTCPVGICGTITPLSRRRK